MPLAAAGLAAAAAGLAAAAAGLAAAAAVAVCPAVHTAACRPGGRPSARDYVRRARPAHPRDPVVGVGTKGAVVVTTRDQVTWWRATPLRGPALHHP
ncbi:hypothetical protein ACX801_17925 [Arthrobacter bambusae]